MAKPGIGSKFVSVNLNDSYGQHSHAPSSSSYGSSRARSGSHGSGGMVVLSRPRSSQKVGPKLSVPPPLNLPSLRKEHERFDLLGPGGGQAGGGSTGSGSRPTSSGMGWTKPGMIALQEKDGVGDCLSLNGKSGSEALGNESVAAGVSHGIVDGVSRGGRSYMPPSARSGPASMLPVERAVVLRGEDFPALQASIPAASGVALQKQKDSLQQKEKHGVGEELPYEQRDNSHSTSLGHIRHHVQSSHYSVGNGVNENGGVSHGLVSHHVMAQTRKQEYFPGPLPLVRFNPRFDWADDERDTSHGLTDKGTSQENPKSEAYWDRDFDILRGSILPHKSTENVFNRRGQRDVGTGKASSGEVPKISDGSDVRNPSREGQENNLWRSSHFQKDGSNVQEVANDKTGVYTGPSSLNLETNKDKKLFRDVARDNLSGVAGNWDSAYGTRDVGFYGQGGRQQWNQNAESHSNWGADENKRYSSKQYSRYRGDAFQNSSESKSSLSLGVKGPAINDPILNFAKEKHPFSKSKKRYIEDPYVKEFSDADLDGRDPFAGGLVGVVKKKDVPKQTDFHDPVRESFEAELERVQKMQEQERQRIIEEQKRALELSRREEEERTRLAREHVERQLRLEEEAREAAWRAEQERLEAMQRAEEQRIAREKENRRILMEEERRKQAAMQKLLELEARIAMRQAKEAKSNSFTHVVADESTSGMAKEKVISRAADMGDWEDGERMVERVTTSAPSDVSNFSRPFEVGSRSHFSKDGSSTYPDRGKPINQWRRDVLENGNNSTFSLRDQENGLHSPRRDTSFGGRAISRKEVNFGGGFMSSRNYLRGEISDSHMEEFNHLKEQRWHLSGDGDHYGRNTDHPEFHENFVEKSSDGGWGQGRSRGNSYSPYPEEPYHNSEADVPHSFGRSRYSLRQPRVLPPPSVSSMHRMPVRVKNQHPGSSTLIDREMQYNYAPRNEPLMQTDFGSGFQERHEHSDMVDVHQHKTQAENYRLNRNTTPGCDSQSSLSVSSPPNSPPHLSHDDLDESGDSSMPSTAAVKGNQPASLNAEAGIEKRMRASSSISAGDDEDWTIQNNEQLQEQEVYDEDEDGFHEEEVHEGDEENIDLTQEFEDLHLEERGSEPMMDNLVLGFDEGVEVKLPSDDCERSSGEEECVFVIPQVSIGTGEVREPFEGMQNDGKILESVNSSPHGNIDSSARIVKETEKSVQDLVAEPTNAPHSSEAPDILGPVDVSSCSSTCLSTQSPGPFATNTGLHSSSDQTTVSVLCSAPNQAELPVKLQFGLFSGPTLIPSPVPAIQIGSIQMPLHLHPQVGPSISHMHPSQPPIFQFGQLRYTSPVSQGILPLAPQSVPYVQPNVPAHFSLTQNLLAPVPFQPAQDTANANLSKDILSSKNLVPGHLDLSHEKVSVQKNALPVKISGEDRVLNKQGQIGISRVGHSTRSESGSQVKNRGHTDRAASASLPYNTKLEGQLQAEASSSMSIARERDLSGSKTQGLVSGGNTRKFFNVRNSGSRSSFLAPEASRADPSGFQRRHRCNIPRTEFRVRENPDRRQLLGLASSNASGLDDKPDLSGRVPGISVRSLSNKDSMLNKPRKLTLESDYIGSVPSSLQEIESGSRDVKGIGKEPLKSQSISHPGARNLKRNISSGDIDSPLQSGIVRVFEQSGIEVPSDEDDFIEVRSKRQMVNDRREQMGKEIKAKSRAPKMPRKTRSTLQNTMVSTSSSKISSLGGEVAKSFHSDFVGKVSQSLADTKVSAGFNTAIVSQPLAPIGTPPVNFDSHADMRSQTVKPLQTSALDGRSFGPSMIHETKNKVLDNVQMSLGSWGNARTSQQVMPLTQSQLDEAMKPAPFETHAVSIGDHIVSVSEPSMSSSSILAKEKSFSSAASPINSLLAGEKIQFGAVTSPTILPPSSRVVLHGIGPPASGQSDIQMPPSLSVVENDCDLLDESCVHLEDCEAEAAAAAAAASAVSVAAINNDEIVGNGLGTCSGTGSKSFSGTAVDGVTTASVAGDRQLSCQSRAEESLSVALPADLSVETPAISLWPPLPSPQNSSSQMLSHFPGGPPSHFPFYDMNPLLGGPIFAFGSHEESAGTHSQPLKSSTSSSGQLGTWQHHSGVDSFYGPPAGFTGPFFSPPGGIPGVQGPPHMVVYNHFAPVGQYGQVGLSFMGTTYIPSGKQADWKHNSTSANGVGEADLNSINMVSSQCNPPNIPAAVQHLAPGSSLLPMPSPPLAMFNVSPFQASPDMSVQARWSHLAASPLHSVPLSLPLQQQPDGVLHSQFSHRPPSVGQPLTASRFSESRTSTPSDGDQSFAVATDATATQFPDELGLVDPSVSASAGASAQTAATKNLSGSTNPDGGKSTLRNRNGGTVNYQTRSSTFKAQSSQQKNLSAQQYNHSTAYNYHRGGGVSRKNSGGEWSHRRMGFPGRNQIVGAEKSLPQTKVKQIYVAKQSSSGTSSLA